MNLLINYMSGDADSSELQSLFSEYGTVTSVSVLDCHACQRSKISAIVKMAESPQAGRVISTRLNNTYWRNGCLKVYMPLFFQDAA
jgi:hypothetical protein